MTSCCHGTDHVGRNHQGELANRVGQGRDQFIGRALERLLVQLCEFPKKQNWSFNINTDLAEGPEDPVRGLEADDGGRSGGTWPAGQTIVCGL